MDILELLLLFISVDIASSSVCSMYHMTSSVLTSFDDLQVTKHQLWSRRSSRVFTCLRSCILDARCVSFHYIKAQSLCVGFPLSFTSPSRTTTTINTGNKLYLTCEGEHHYGASCSQSSDCSPPFTDCLEDVCACQTGYSFSSTTLECVEDYLGCFTDDFNRLLDTHVDDYRLTREACIEYCLTRDYRYAGMEVSIECHCGNVLDMTNYQQKHDSDCSMACAGDTSQMCGSHWRISVFKIKD